MEDRGYSIRVRRILSLIFARKCPNFHARLHFNEADLSRDMYLIKK
jgi:hypothetical protein